MSSPDNAGPSEAPAFAQSPQDCRILSLRIVGKGNLVRIEFSRSVSRAVALAKLVRFKGDHRWVVLEPDRSGHHIWIVGPSRAGGFSPGMALLERILVPEVVEALEKNSAFQLAVLTREQWLSKAVQRYEKENFARKEWEERLHPLGLTYGQIYNMDDGWYTGNGWIWWVGHSQSDTHRSFQTMERARQERYNQDIELLLEDGHDLTMAVQIQNEMWMQIYIQMVAAFANALSSASGPAPKPRLSRPIRRAGRPPKIDEDAVGDAIKAVEKNLGYAAQTASIVLAFKEAWEHATESLAEAEIVSQINRDVERLTNFLMTLRQDGSPAED